MVLGRWSNNRIHCTDDFEVYGTIGNELDGRGNYKWNLHISLILMSSSKDLKLYISAPSSSSTGTLLESFVSYLSGDPSCIPHSCCPYLIFDHIHHASLIITVRTKSFETPIRETLEARSKPSKCRLRYPRGRRWN
jgi:hypothetical protein